MKPGYYWVALKNYPSWEIMYYLEGKFFVCNARHTYVIDDMKVITGPIPRPNDPNSPGCPLETDLEYLYENTLRPS